MVRPNSRGFQFSAGTKIGKVVSITNADSLNQVELRPRTINCWAEKMCVLREQYFTIAGDKLKVREDDPPGMYCYWVLVCDEDGGGDGGSGGGGSGGGSGNGSGNGGSGGNTGGGSGSGANNGSASGNANRFDSECNNENTFNNYKSESLVCDYISNGNYQRFKMCMIESLLAKGVNLAENCRKSYYKE